MGGPIDAPEAARGIHIYYSYLSDSGDSWTGVFHVASLAADVSENSNYRLVGSARNADRDHGPRLSVAVSGLCWEQEDAASSRFIVFSQALTHAVRRGAGWCDLLATGSFRVDADGAMVIRTGAEARNLLGCGGRISFRADAAVARPAGLELLRAAASALTGWRRRGGRQAGRLQDLQAC